MTTSSAHPVPSSNAERVREFHTTVGTQPPGTPTLPSSAALALRRTLITEEYNEVLAALDSLDAARDGDARETRERLGQLAQELADLLYVVYGGFCDCGIDADAVFGEVHRANLTKAQGPKRDDGKAMKPDGWQPPDIDAVIFGTGHADAGVR